MPDLTPGASGAVATLTDGTGVSAITSSKVLKDFVADVLLTGAAALAAVQITGLDQAAAQPTIVWVALGGAVIRAGYRAVLRWATS